MKQEDVPQDRSFLEGLKKATYAVDAQGRYVVVPISGYDPETDATSVALAAQDRIIQDAWERARRGEVSPLAYHFAVRHWTLALAAAETGLWRPRVWWHLRPAGFRRLSPALRARYARALGLDEAALGGVPDAPALALGVQGA